MKFSESTLKASVWADALKVTRVVVAAIVALLLCYPVFSQGNQGTIQGGVFDQSGGAIAGATVTIVDASRGLSRPLTTDSAGAYVGTNLTPGTYTVRAEAKGFQTVEHPNVLVEVGQNIRVDLTLQPGAQTQTITVTSDVPAVNTTDATLGGTVNNQAINALPLNGRNYQRLLGLRPGVVAAIGAGTGTESSNGLRSGQNLTLIEGLAGIGSSHGGSMLNTSYHQGDATSILPIDAIQEFNIEQNPKAEYGWVDGAVQNIGVKSGTNSLHGTAYAFGRDDAWDASNYFAGPIPLSLQQYGATAGGRIIKHKLFWFLGYEKLQYTVGDSATDTLPSDVSATTIAGQGVDTTNSMVDACNDLVNVKHLAINSLSALLAGLNTTTCAVTPAGATENAFPFVGTAPKGGKPVVVAPGVTSTNPIHNGVAKLDYNVGAHNHLAGMFFIGYSNGLVQLDSGQLEQQWLNQNLTRTEDGTGSWVWTPNSTWVNEFRGGYGMIHNIGVAADSNVNVAAPWPAGYGLPSSASYGGFPKLQINGFTGFLGQGQRNGVRGPEGTVNFVDNVSFLHGKHAFKFGFEYLDEVYDNNAFNYANGAVTFGAVKANGPNPALTALEGFLTAAPGTNPSKGTILLGNPAIFVRGRAYAGFIQDDWRIVPRITLNLGLRYQYDATPTEKNNYIGNFYPNVNPLTTSALGQAGGPFPALYSPDKRDFSPRFGVAWDVTGNGKTVVRAGASLIDTFVVLADLVDFVPFGANVPAIGYNASGTAANANTPNQLGLVASQINWNTAGPVFPNPGAVPLVTTGAFAGSYTGLSCTYIGETGLPAGYKPAQCSPVATPSNFRTPYTVEWNLDIQRAITNNLTVEVAYVGNHGFDQPSRMDINQPPLGWGWNNPSAALPVALGGPLPGGVSPAACLLSACATSSTIATAVTGNEITGRPYNSQFPYISNINQTGNLYSSSYNGLQVTVTQRVSRGLTFLVGYTFSHALDDHSSDSIQSPGPTDVRNLSGNFANSDSDSRQRFTLSSTYAIPGIKSPLQMLQGWSVSPIIALYSGTPWFASDATTDFTGTGEINNSSSPGIVPWNYSGPRSAFTSGPTSIPFLAGAAAATNAICVTAAQAPYTGNAQLMSLALAALTNLGCYVQGSGVLTPPAYGTVGNAGRNVFRGPSYYNVDLSIAKDWKFRERYSAQFRAEFFNLFNRADFANPKVTDPSAGGQFGCSCLTPDATGFTNSVLGSGSARSIQLGLKLTF